MVIDWHEKHGQLFCDGLRGADRRDCWMKECRLDAVSLSLGKAITNIQP